MEFGDMVLVGWNGSPIYKEVVAPSVSYAPEYNDQTFQKMTKTLRRKLHCRVVDVATVISGLQALNNTISYSAPNANGVANTTISYGSGWKLKDYGEAPTGNNLFAEINITYEKTITSAFDGVGLPAGITMTDDGGIGYIKYLENTLFSFNPKSLGDSSGWTHDAVVSNTFVYSAPHIADVNGAIYQSGKRIEVYIDEIIIKFNGFEVFRVTPNPADYSADLLPVKYVGGNIDRYDSNGDPVTVEDAKAQLGLDETDYLYLLPRYNNYGPKSVYLLKKFVPAYWTYPGSYQIGFALSGSKRIYRDGAVGLIWDVSVANKKVLKFGQLTVFDFDVTGLA